MSQLYRQTDVNILISLVIELEVDFTSNQLPLIG